MTTERAAFMKQDKKKLILILIILSAICLICGYLYYLSLEKKEVKENSVVVYGIPELDSHVKEVITTTNQWVKETVTSEIVQDDGLRRSMEQYNETAEDFQNAYIEKTTEGFVIVPEKEGKDLDIENSILSMKVVLQSPSKRTEDFEKLCEKANKYSSWSITYDNGQTVQSSLEQIDIVDGKIRVKDSFVDEQVRALSYNPEGSGADFTTSAGENIHVSGGTYGSVINYDGEIEEVKKILRTGESVQGRRPLFKKERPEKVENDYIEISIDAQHMWLYRNGALVAETDVVTGDASKGRDTPTGVYYVMEKLREKWMNGGDSPTLAHQWMRVTLSGVGIHDAWWRSSFGGSIYVYNGSHGCINTPSWIMETFYENSEEGMPIVIY